MPLPTDSMNQVSVIGSTITQVRRSGQFLAAIGVLGLLPIAPEGCLWLNGYTDLKSFASIAYYECIVSLILLCPALFLPRRLAQTWIVLLAFTIGLATLVTGFEAIAMGTRWDMTDYGAIYETNRFEAVGFVRGFATAHNLSFLGGIAAAFATAATIAFRAKRPTRTAATVALTSALLVASYGLAHAIRYGGSPVQYVRINADTVLGAIAPSRNSYHPLLQLVLTHWNYSASHRYREKVLRETSKHLGELRGAVPVPDATPPRVILLVIGESSSRRHWSLYGYRRHTNPELGRLSSELVVFRDAICRTTASLTEIQGMLCTPEATIPIFSLFSGAGYETHWFSAQFDQGPSDVKLAALVQSCDEKVFLNGAYDERLVPLVKRAASSPGKHLIVVNMFGSHIRYDDRYPKPFAVFQGTAEKEHRIAAYDNSIRYTDHVLAAMIETLREFHEPTCFLYLSDHSEDVYDSNPTKYLFRSDTVATDAMFEIPMLAWFSPEYREANAEIVHNAIAAETKPFQSVGLYHTLIDLARLRHRVFIPSRSFFSGSYAPPERHVGAAARIYYPHAQNAEARRSAALAVPSP